MWMEIIHCSIGQREDKEEEIVKRGFVEETASLLSGSFSAQGSLGALSANARRFSAGFAAATKVIARTRWLS